MQIATYATGLSETFRMWVRPGVRGSDNGGEFTGDAFTSLLREHVVTPRRTTSHNGKIEHVEGRLEPASGQTCTEWIMFDVVQLYKTKWIHRAVGMTPDAARTAGINWRGPSAAINVQIETNLAWIA
jgi:transposase InsO family protein